MKTTILLAGIVLIAGAGLATAQYYNPTAGTPNMASPPPPAPAPGHSVICRGCGFPNGACAAITIDQIAGASFSGSYNGQYDNGAPFSYAISGSYSNGQISFRTQLGSSLVASLWPDKLVANFQSYSGPQANNVNMMCTGNPQALASPR